MYAGQSKETLSSEKARVSQVYQDYLARNLNLNMSRGMPGQDQLDLSEGLLTVVSSSEECFTSSGDARNYGLLEGLPEAKALMACFLDVSPDDVIVGGSSSLNLMYDTISRGVNHGFCGHAPWGGQKVKIICPSPGYDRHFGITQHFGIDMAPVAMGPGGPDMDAVEELVLDPAVKGMWCVPKYSNPTGIIFSDDTVRRIANLKPSAPDFKVLWDNAYAVHGLYGDEPPLLNITREAKTAGNPEMIIQFASTSKVTFPGGGISVVAAGPRTLTDIKESMFYRTICSDKINQLRHVRFLRDMEGVRRHMRRHAALLRPKFEAVEEILTRELKGLAQWTTPRGGYFVSLDVVPGTAKRTVSLMKQAGVVMTAAGATWPYGRDPEDKNIRIAPTCPPLSELRLSMELLCVCAKLAALETLTQKNP